jgi:hypothetical protein
VPSQAKAIGARRVAAALDRHLEEDVASHLERAAVQRRAGAEEEGIEGLAVAAREVLVLHVVLDLQRVLERERLQVVADLVGHRLEELVLPVPGLVEPREREEGPVVERDDRADLARAAELRGVVLREALAQRVDLGDRGVRHRLPRDLQPVHPRAELRRDVVEDLLRPCPELLEGHPAPPRADLEGDPRALVGRGWMLRKPPNSLRSDTPASSDPPPPLRDPPGRPASPGVAGRALTSGSPVSGRRGS